MFEQIKKLKPNILLRKCVTFTSINYSKKFACEKITPNLLYCRSKHFYILQFLVKKSHAFYHNKPN